MFDENEFKDIPGFEGLYRISSSGEVISKKSGKWLKLKWAKLTRGYPAINLYLIPNKSISHYIHRLVFTAHIGAIPKEKEIDHINRIKTDNRLENLRLVTNSENKYNSTGRRTRKTSKFKGVCFDKNRKKWHVSICVDSKPINIGRFKTEVSAAIAYDLAAIKYHGKYAVTNLIKTADMLEKQC